MIATKLSVAFVIAFGFEPFFMGIDRSSQHPSRDNSVCKVVFGSLWLEPTGYSLLYLLLGSRTAVKLQ